MVRLRLSTSGFDKTATENEIDSYFETLQYLVKENIVTNKDEPMARVVGNLLLHENKFVATAESCTGGYIAHLITSMPGSSQTIVISG